LVNALPPRGTGESRPRWLTFLVVELDQKIRLWLYNWMPVHPTFSPVAWLLLMGVTPVCLYRLLMNVTRDRAASLGGLAVYLSSLGFLSAFTMLFLPGKSLTNTIFIGALLAGSVAVRGLRPGQLLVDAPGVSKWVMLLVILAGLFVDE